MPTVITPNATPSFPIPGTGFNAPANGETCDANSVLVAFQALEDGVECSRLAAYGRKLQPTYQITTATSTGAGASVLIQPLGPVALTSGGQWFVKQHLLSSTKVLKTMNGGVSLTTKTRYYIYAFINAGVLDFTVSTTEPGSTGQYMKLLATTSNTDYAYVGTFLTDPSVTNNVFPCFESGGFHKQGPDVGIAVLSGNSDGGSNALNVYNHATYGAVVPPGVMLMKLLVGAYSSTMDTLHVLGGPSTSGFAIPTQVVNVSSTAEIWLASEDRTNIYYGWGVGSTGRNANLLVQGWQVP